MKRGQRFRDSPRGLSYGTEARLRRESEFRVLFRSGKGLQSGVFRVRVAPNGLSHARLGLAVPRTRLRLAVDRNRLRRVLRASFQEEQKALRGWDVLILFQGNRRTPIRDQRIWVILDRLWRKVRHFVRLSGGLPGKS